MNLSRLLGATMVAGALGAADASAAHAHALSGGASGAASAAKAPADHVPDSRSGSGAAAGFAMPSAGAAGQ
jgi:hypothetical protein